MAINLAIVLLILSLPFFDVIDLIPYWLLTSIFIYVILIYLFVQGNSIHHRDTYGYCLLLRRFGVDPYRTAELAEVLSESFRGKLTMITLMDESFSLDPNAVRILFGGQLKVFNFFIAGCIFLSFVVLSVYFETFVLGAKDLHLYLYICCLPFFYLLPSNRIARWLEGIVLSISTKAAILMNRDSILLTAADIQRIIEEIKEGYGLKKGSYIFKCGLKNWRRAVSRLLSNASAVIIEATEITESLSWEIEQIIGGKSWRRMPTVLLCEISKREQFQYDISHLLEKASGDLRFKNVVVIFYNIETEGGKRKLVQNIQTVFVSGALRQYKTW